MQKTLRGIELIEAWQASGMSKKRFCESQGIRTQTFYYWYKKCRASDAPLSGFTKVNLAPSAQFAEIHFINGCRVTLHQPVNAEFILQLTK